MLHSYAQTCTWNVIFAFIAHSLLPLSSRCCKAARPGAVWLPADSDGNPAETPVYSECTDGSGTFTFSRNDGSWTDVTVDWGDGSAPSFLPNGTNLWPSVTIMRTSPWRHMHLAFLLRLVQRRRSKRACLSIRPSCPRVGKQKLCSAHGELSECLHQRHTGHRIHLELHDSTSFSIGAENAGDTVDHLFNTFNTGCQRLVTLWATNDCRTRSLGWQPQTPSTMSTFGTKTGRPLARLTCCCAGLKTP